MRWVNTTGGPIICAEEFVAQEWMGIKGSSITEAGGPRSDYERACSVQEYLEILQCNAGKILVLGDEPFQSSFLVADEQFCIVRWVYAESNINEDFLRTKLNNTIQLAQNIAFSVMSGILIMFDSSLPGTSIGGECQRASINRGEYHITTEKVEIRMKFSFLVHRFVKLGA